MNIIRRPIQIWLAIGVFMVFVQVVVGGITRLTDSGLSITEWAVIQGTIPPLNEADWIDAFEQYKLAAKKQYESLHADMSLSDFKFIYFWEYLHRLWARFMGFVFLFPFLFFLWKRWMPTWLIRRLGIVILLAMAAAAFGWIMVASGLNEDNRTWVSAYKLVGHLSIAATLFGYLFWTHIKASQPKVRDGHLKSLRRFAWGVAALLFLQIVFGGLMAGMRAGLVHPHFPFFVEGQRLLAILGAGDADFVNYESSAYVKGFVQILHRFTAYLLVFVTFLFVRKTWQADISTRLRYGTYGLIGLLSFQFILGILTVINCIGSVPIMYGALHQGIALILLANLLYVIYQLTESRKIEGRDRLKN